MPALGRLQIVKARESNGCSECEARIDAGELYFSLSGRTQRGMWLNNKLHLPCLISMAKRRYAQKDVSALPEDQKVLRRKLLNARSYALRTGNKERLREIQQALATLGVEAPYRSSSRARRDELYQDDTVEAAIERGKEAAIKKERTEVLLHRAYGTYYEDHKPSREELAWDAEKYIREGTKSTDPEATAELVRRYHLEDTPAKPPQRTEPEAETVNGLDAEEPPGGFPCDLCGVPTKSVRHKAAHKKVWQERMEGVKETERVMASSASSPIEGEEE